MLKLGLLLVVPYLAAASIATGAVDGTDAMDAIQNIVGQVSEQSDEVATAIVYGPSDLDHKITVCHLPDGDPEKAHLMSIALEAWANHEAHGDLKLSNPALLAEPLMTLCADNTEVVSEEASEHGKAPEHSNAGGKSDDVETAGGEGSGHGGPPEHSNGRGKPSDD